MDVYQKYWTKNEMKLVEQYQNGWLINKFCICVVALAVFDAMCFMDVQVM